MINLSSPDGIVLLAKKSGLTSFTSLQTFVNTGSPSTLISLNAIFISSLKSTHRVKIKLHRNILKFPIVFHIIF